jgi:hypothetical protein
MTPEEFERCFEGFNASAFRMETLQRYTVTSEAERVQAFLHGEPRPDRSVRTSPWLRRVAVTTAAGKHWSRLHIVDLPLTDYLRYQLAGYLESAAAGEEIRIAIRGDHPELAGLREDFWLFDADRPDTYAIAMRFDQIGRPLDHEFVTDPRRLAVYRAARSAAWDASMSLNKFLAANARHWQARSA